MCLCVCLLRNAERERLISQYRKLYSITIQENCSWQRIEHSTRSFWSHLSSISRFNHDVILELVRFVCFTTETLSHFTFLILWGFFMRLHFLISISVVLTHPGWKASTEKTNSKSNQPFSVYSPFDVAVGGGKRDEEWEQGEQLESHMHRRRLTTGRWTSQKALSWLSRIFLSILSFFLSILQMRSASLRQNVRSAFLELASEAAGEAGLGWERGEIPQRSSVYLD